MAVDHMQTICTSFQTNSHANTPSVNSVDALLDFQPTVLLLTAEVKMKIYTIRTRLTDPYPG